MYAEGSKEGRRRRRRRRRRRHEKRSMREALSPPFASVRTK
jgi:hypothetical protein